MINSTRSTWAKICVTAKMMNIESKVWSRRRKVFPFALPWNSNVHNGHKNKDWVKSRQSNQKLVEWIVHVRFGQNHNTQNVAYQSNCSRHTQHYTFHPKTASVDFHDFFFGPRSTWNIQVLKWMITFELKNVFNKTEKFCTPQNCISYVSPKHSWRIFCDHFKCILESFLVSYKGPVWVIF